MNISDKAKQTILDALADLPSGPPPEEVLNVLLAQAWGEGFDEGLSAGRGSRSEPNPYEKDAP